MRLNLFVCWRLFVCGIQLQWFAAYTVRNVHNTNLPPQFARHSDSVHCTFSRAMLCCVFFLLFFVMCIHTFRAIAPKFPHSARWKRKRWTDRTTRAKKNELNVYIHSIIDGIICEKVQWFLNFKKWNECINRISIRRENNYVLMILWLFIHFDCNNKWTDTNLMMRKRMGFSVGPYSEGRPPMFTRYVYGNVIDLFQQLSHVTSISK